MKIGMSMTINIAGKQAVLADGKWRAADAELAELLNLHLATVQVPGHYPPADRERIAAQAVLRDFDARIVDQHLARVNPSRMPDGWLIVY